MAGHRPRGFNPRFPALLCAHGLPLLLLRVSRQLFIIHINRTAWQLHGKKEKLKHKVEVRGC
jgi:hypothetical protein